MQYNCPVGCVVNTEDQIEKEMKEFAPTYINHREKMRKQKHLKLMANHMVDNHSKDELKIWNINRDLIRAYLG